MTEEWRGSGGTRRRKFLQAWTSLCRPSPSPSQTNTNHDSQTTTKLWNDLAVLIGTFPYGEEPMIPTTTITTTATPTATTTTTTHLTTTSLIHSLLSCRSLDWNIQFRLGLLVLRRELLQHVPSSDPYPSSSNGALYSRKRTQRPWEDSNHANNHSHLVSFELEPLHEAIDALFHHIQSKLGSQLSILRPSHETSHQPVPHEKDQSRFWKNDKDDDNDMMLSHWKLLPNPHDSKPYGTNNERGDTSCLWQQQQQQQPQRHDRWEAQSCVRNDLYDLYQGGILNEALYSKSKTICQWIDEWVVSVVVGTSTATATTTATAAATPTVSRHHRLATTKPPPREGSIAHFCRTQLPNHHTMDPKNHLPPQQQQECRESMNQDAPNKNRLDSSIEEDNVDHDVVTLPSRSSNSMNTNESIDNQKQNDTETARVQTLACELCVWYAAHMSPLSICSCGEACGVVCMSSIGNHDAIRIVGNETNRQVRNHIVTVLLQMSDQEARSILVHDVEEDGRQKHVSCKVFHRGRARLLAHWLASPLDKHHSHAYSVDPHVRQFALALLRPSPLASIWDMCNRSRHMCTLLKADKDGTKRHRPHDVFAMSPEESWTISSSSSSVAVAGVPSELSMELCVSQFLTPNAATTESAGGMAYSRIPIFRGFGPMGIDPMVDAVPDVLGLTMDLWNLLIRACTRRNHHATTTTTTTTPSLDCILRLTRKFSKWLPLEQCLLDQYRILLQCILSLSNNDTPIQTTDTRTSPLDDKHNTRAQNNDDDENTMLTRWQQTLQFLLSRMSMASQGKMLLSATQFIHTLAYPEDNNKPVKIATSHSSQCTHRHDIWTTVFTQDLCDQVLMPISFHFSAMMHHIVLVEGEHGMESNMSAFASIAVKSTILCSLLEAIVDWNGTHHDDSQGTGSAGVNSTSSSGHLTDCERLACVIYNFLSCNAANMYLMNPPKQGMQLMESCLRIHERLRILYLDNWGYSFHRTGCNEGKNSTMRYEDDFQSFHLSRAAHELPLAEAEDTKDPAVEGDRSNSKRIVVLVPSRVDFIKAVISFALVSSTFSSQRVESWCRYVVNVGMQRYSTTSQSSCQNCDLLLIWTEELLSNLLANNQTTLISESLPPLLQCLHENVLRQNIRMYQIMSKRIVELDSDQCNTDAKKNNRDQSFAAILMKLLEQQNTDDFDLEENVHTSMSARIQCIMAILLVTPARYLFYHGTSSLDGKNVDPSERALKVLLHRIGRLDLQAVSVIMIGFGFFVDRLHGQSKDECNTVCDGGNTSSCDSALNSSIFQDFCEDAVPRWLGSGGKSFVHINAVLSNVNFELMGHGALFGANWWRKAVAGCKTLSSLCSISSGVGSHNEQKHARSPVEATYMSRRCRQLEDAIVLISQCGSLEKDTRKSGRLRTLDRMKEPSGCKPRFDLSNSDDDVHEFDEVTDVANSSRDVRLSSATQIIQNLFSKKDSTSLSNEGRRRPLLDNHFNDEHHGSIEPELFSDDTLTTVWKGGSSINDDEQEENEDEGSQDDNIDDILLMEL
eukprot:CAMPEP_0198290484 /NCGR_PEP_ID=MMETSP1449-20131203/8333_1 /TAXON_ID=420275 /ORGANISM="Attheya septentrionalis, Strain CCMP2084" /LENGTH=1524 /DNA_ID=CAMNT_0043988993 /DNA_START=214 /DNA_END=4788 /DNA_ORIENTATION=+